MAGTKWEFLVIGPLYGWFCFAVGMLLVALVGISLGQRDQATVVELKKGLIVVALILAVLAVAGVPAGVPFLALAVLVLCLAELI